MARIHVKCLPLDTSCRGASERMQGSAQTIHRCPSPRPPAILQTQVATPSNHILHHEEYIQCGIMEGGGMRNEGLNFKIRAFNHCMEEPLSFISQTTPTAIQVYKSHTRESLALAILSSVRLLTHSTDMKQVPVQKSSSGLTGGETDFAALQTLKRLRNCL